MLVLTLLSCQDQAESKAERSVGGPCEDCDALLDYKILDLSISSVATIPGYDENDPKIKITGTIYANDRKTLAEGVIVYVYHTNREGRYAPSDDPVGSEKRHGQHRAWVKTDADGSFALYTFRPAVYPGLDEPEHIHIYLKEHGTGPYYIDSYVFEDDPLLTQEKLAAKKNRGGSGLISLESQDGILTAHRDIILGSNISNYD